MTQVKEVSVDTESVEFLFMDTIAKDQGCSLQPVRGEAPCPAYFSVLQAAAEWHAVTAVFAVMIVFMFLGMALGKKDE